MEQKKPLRRDYVNGRYGQMHYRYAKPDAPTGKRPLLLFHMSPYSSFIYETFGAEMGRDRLTLAIDTPGFGASDPPPSPPELVDYASAMGDVMDALGLRDVDVMGYHTGSKIALALAIQRPAQLHRIVNVSATIFTPEELAEHKQMYGPEEVADDGSHFVKWWNTAKRWRMKGVTNEALAERFAVRMANPGISWWGHRAAFNFLTADALPQVQHPVLILNPEDDLVEFTPRAKPLLKNPASRIHDLPGWSHGFLDLETAKSAKIVRDFLDA
jgi:pimeloyl-ACP methyl ester carboxylesterase